MNSATEQPLVSVIIPFYKRAINSVFNQTYKNWELILVDDGSTDSSYNLVKNYCAHSNKSFIIRQTNKGPSAARNAGMYQAKGEYISFFFFYDRWHDRFLSIMMDAIMLCNSVDWIYCDAERREENTEELVVQSVFNQDTGNYLRQLKTQKIKKLNMIDDERLMYVAIAASIKEGANSIIKKKVFDSIKYDENVRIVEDKLLHITAISKGFKFGYISEVLLTKYHHGQNISIVDSKSADKMIGLLENKIKLYQKIINNITLNNTEKSAAKNCLSRTYMSLARAIMSSNQGTMFALNNLIKAIYRKPLLLSHYRNIGGLARDFLRYKASLISL